MKAFEPTKVEGSFSCSMPRILAPSDRNDKALSCTVIKLGGSVLTKVDGRPKFNRPEVKRFGVCLRRLTASRRAGVIVLLGGGAYGHPIARMLGIRPDGMDGVRKDIFRLSNCLSHLTHLFAEVLSAEGVDVAPLQASSLFVSNNGAIRIASVLPLHHAFELGFVPVITGGVIFDLRLGPILLSSDRVPIAINSGMEVREFIALTDQAGIRSVEGHLVKSVTPKNCNEVLHFIEPPCPSNVSGGMLGKLRAALDLAQQGVRTVIGDGRDLKPDYFERLMTDDPPGTVIEAWDNLPRDP